MPPNAVMACPLRARVDPRLLKFSAGATAIVLVAALVLMSVVRPLGLFLLVSQVAVFAFTAFVSFQWSVWAQLFARVVWPRIAAPTSLEGARPPRFAQGIGFVLTALAVIAFILGIDLAGYVLTAAVVGMAALTAFTGFCLGCKIHLLIRGRQPA